MQKVTLYWRKKTSQKELPRYIELHSNTDSLCCLHCNGKQLYNFWLNGIIIPELHKEIHCNPTVNIVWKATVWSSNKISAELPKFFEGHTVHTYCVQNIYISQLNSGKVISSYVDLMTSLSGNFIYLNRPTLFDEHFDEQWYKTPIYTR